MYLPDVNECLSSKGRTLGYSDHYGALWIAAQYCGIEQPTKPFNAVWMHGCIGPWRNIDQGGLGIDADTPKSRRIYVAREDQEVFLKSCGYHRAKAIGLPMVYTSKQPVERIPRSLLVMPMHTIRGVSVVNPSVFDDYVDCVMRYANGYDKIVACLHHDCIENGYWAENFRARGIEVVLGAGTNDLNALNRMRCLFEQFEAMTTNGWGSHVAYALYFGAEVAIHGPEVKVCEEDMLQKDSTWRRNQEAFRKLSAPEIKDSKNKILQHLFRSPDDTIADREFGEFLVGHANKIASARMREEFRWTKGDLLFHRIASASGLLVIVKYIQELAVRIGLYYRRKLNR